MDFQSSSTLGIFFSSWKPVNSLTTLLTGLTVEYIYIYIYIYNICIYVCPLDCINPKTFLSQVHQWGKNDPLGTASSNVHILLAPDERWVSKISGIVSDSGNLTSEGQATLYTTNPTSLHWDWVPEYPVNGPAIKCLSFCRVLEWREDYIQSR